MGQSGRRRVEQEEAGGGGGDSVGDEMEVGECVWVVIFLKSCANKKVAQYSYFSRFSFKFK